VNNFFPGGSFFGAQFRPGDREKMQFFNGNKTMKTLAMTIPAVFLMLCFGVCCFAACPSMDITGDCRVNFGDFYVLASDWMGAYGTEDLSDMAGQWLTQGVEPDAFFEGFETGDFSRYAWQQSGDSGWVIVSSPVYEGTYAVQSGAISDSQISTLEITLDTPSDAICFYAKVSSENGYDFLHFYIDDILQDSWSGSQEWTRQVFSFSAGVHTFRWSYGKDSSDSAGEDCAWIDAVRLGTLTVVPDVSGMSQAHAQAALANVGLVMGTVSKAFSATVAEGSIISQCPIGGENSLIGEAVNLTISGGPAPVPVLDMTWVFVDDRGFSGEGYVGQMSKYETTNAQYCEFLNTALASGDIAVSGTTVYGANGSNLGADYVGTAYYLLDGAGFVFDGATNGGAARIHYTGSVFVIDMGFENHPVTYASWYGAMAFCNYYDFRLPMAWEWKAVADYKGTYTYGCGTTINNTKANYLGSTHPHGTTIVGAFGEYGYGMADMAGNVFEWARDHSSANLSAICGGSWNLNSLYCQLSYESYYDPSGWPHIGFRVCR
jgi:hypothetical protein